MAFRFEQVKEESQQDRTDRLDKEWDENLPCSTCDMADICRFRRAVKRIDYPGEVFDIKVTCKIKSGYRAVKEERL